MSNEIEEVIGDPWSVLPVKTRKFAKECTEITLSKRKITELGKFTEFPNLEALWINKNNVNH